MRKTVQEWIAYVDEVAQNKCTLYIRYRMSEGQRQKIVNLFSEEEKPYVLATIEAAYTKKSTKLEELLRPKEDLFFNEETLMFEVRNAA